jgi:hypothetical protein
MYEFFEDEKRYYIVTEYGGIAFYLSLGSARVVSCSMRSSPEANSQKKMPPFS